MGDGPLRPPSPKLSGLVPHPPCGDWSAMLGTYGELDASADLLE